MSLSNKHTFVVLAFKETPLLRRCIDSIKKQTFLSNVVIATSTPNDFINDIANEYDLQVIINSESKGIGYDFNFALNCVDSDIITIAHQDDIYESSYCESICNAKNCNNASIIFTDSYDLINGEKLYNSTNQNVKKMLLSPLKSNLLSNTRFSRRFCLCYGNSIPCPAVSFIKRNIPDDLFRSDMKSNVDWFAWEVLSRQDNPFVYIPQPLVGHTISENTTTTSIINQGIRTQEDYYMFKKFWPTPIAKLLQKLYSSAEKGNEI